MIQISDKVVCIDDSPGKGRNKFSGVPLPIKRGVVYVVRSTAINQGPMKNELVLRLVGLNLGVNERGDEFGFWHRRFRKLADIQAENAARHAESSLENASVRQPDQNPQK